MSYRFRTNVPFWQLDPLRKTGRKIGLRENVECGLHSGFPWCCILWYCSVWRLLTKWPWGRNRYHNWRRKEGVNYVRCPFCKVFNRKIVRVRACARQENGEHVLGPYLDEIGYGLWTVDIRERKMR